MSTLKETVFTLPGTLERTHVIAAKRHQNFNRYSKYNRDISMAKIAGVASRTIDLSNKTKCIKQCSDGLPAD